MGDEFLINVNPTLLQLQSGNQAEANISISNKSTIFHSYTITIEGQEKAWARLDRSTLSALSNQQTENALLALTVPPDARSGVYQLKIIVTADDLPSQPTEAVLDVEVEASSATIDPASPSAFSHSNLPKRDDFPTETGFTNQVKFATTSGIKANILIAPDNNPNLSSRSWLVEVINNDTQDRIINYSLGVVGLPATWSVVEPLQLALNSKESGKVRLTVNPSKNAPSGTYKFTLRVYSHLNPQARVEIPCIFEINNSTSENQVLYPLQPLRVRNGSLELVSPQRSVDIRPGEQTQLGLTLYNRGVETTILRLKVLGLPREWYGLKTNQIELGSNQNASVQLLLHPGRDTLPGNYPLAVQVQSDRDSTLTLKAIASLEIVEGSEPYVPAIKIEIEPNPEVIRPGSQHLLKVSMHNLSARHDVYSLKIEGTGIDPNSVRIEQPRPQVPPFGETSAQLNFQIQPDIVAGVYPIQLRVFSEIYPNIEGSANYQLKVPVIGDCKLGLTTPKGKGAGEVGYQLEVHNLANAPLRLKLSALEKSPSSSLVFHFTPAECEIPANGKEQVSLVVTPRHLVSSDDPKNFEIRGEGSYMLGEGGLQAAEIKPVLGCHVQEVPPTLAPTLDPLENQTDQMTWYEVELSNPGSERIKIRFKMSNGSDKLEYKLEPSELTLNPGQTGKSLLTISHPQRAISNKPETYTFKVQAEFAGEGVGPVATGFTEEGRFIYRRLLTPPPPPPLIPIIAATVMIAGLLTAGVAWFLLNFTNPKQLTPTAIALRTATPLTTDKTVSTTAAIVTTATETTPGVPAPANNANAAATAKANADATLTAQTIANLIAKANTDAALTAKANTDATLTAKANADAIAKANADAALTAEALTAKANANATLTAQTIATLTAQALTAKANADATLTAQALTAKANADATFTAKAIPGANEDCLPYNPANLRIVNEGTSGWLLTDGASRMLVLDNQQDAQNALLLAKSYSFHCFIGRNNTRTNRSDYIVQYWR